MGLFRFPCSSGSSAFGSLFAILIFLSSETHLGRSVLIVRNQMNRPHRSRPVLRTNQTTCPLFIGSWVRDESFPLYQPSQCPIIDPQFDCKKFGRPDSDYLKYRWQPLKCDLPRFEGSQFLEYMQGKSLMFVGDSLGRNQWESLICMILATVPDSEMQMIRGEPLSTFKFLYYNVTLSYYKAPYLVDIDAVQGRRVLKLQEISENGNAWVGADVLSFNTGHWWTHTGSKQGWDYMEYEGESHQDMDRLVALAVGLKTWASWVDSNIDRTKTKVFFLSISPTHDNPAEWNGGVAAQGGQNCYGETEPITEGTSGLASADAFSDEMKVVNQVMNGMNNPPYLLDITMLSELRKDGHPSVYSGLLSPGQRASPARSADCSHWCLPGLPDTWNQLFYATLLF